MTDSIPHILVPGTKALAGEVQDNFEWLLNKLDSKVSHSQIQVSTGLTKITDVNGNMTLSANVDVLPIITNTVYVSSGTLYVATTGNDTTGDGTNAKPFLTIHKALDYLNGKTLLGSITIQVADGTYTITSQILINHPQGSLISLMGNLTTPANCILKTTTAINLLILTNSGLNVINGFTLQGNRVAGSYGINALLSTMAIGGAMIIDSFDIGIMMNTLSSTSIGAGAVIKNCITLLAAAINNSFIDARNITLQGYNSPYTTYGIECAVNSGFDCFNNAISKCTTGAYCNQGSFIADNGTTYTSCSTNRSPASNTTGNANSYIQT